MNARLEARLQATNRDPHLRGDNIIKNEQRLAKRNAPTKQPSLASHSITFTADLRRLRKALQKVNEVVRAQAKRERRYSG